MLMPEGPGLWWIGSFNRVISLFLWTWLGVCLRATAGFTKNTVWKVCIFHCTNNGQKASSQEQYVSTALHIVHVLKRKRNGAGLLQKWDRNAIEVSFPAQGLAAAAASSGSHLCHGLSELLQPPEITHPRWKKAENGPVFNLCGSPNSWGQSLWVGSRDPLISTRWRVGAKPQDISASRTALTCLDMQRPSLTCPVMASRPLATSSTTYAQLGSKPAEVIV